MRFCLILLLCVTFGCTTQPSREVANPDPVLERPNIVWISAEDMSPRLGSYGDEVARTPNLDELAARGTRYTRVFTTAGVCSPSRAAIITGMHQVSIGAHHMRTLSGAPFAPEPAPYSVVPPHYVKTFTEYLRAAGYYVTNNGKEDYQFETPATAWDESSNTAHWRNRPDADQPFFAVFNIMATHESRIWPDPKAAFRALGLPEEFAHPAPEPLVTNPDSVSVPPIYPDTPVVRRDIAQQYDNISRVDMRAGEILSQLEEDGLLDNTIVFFWSDHGDGLPRHKRWVYDSGLHVPLIVHIPGQAPRIDGHLVSFLDLAPTVLSLAGVEPPTHMQGRAFSGHYFNNNPVHDYVYSARDRFDEQYDMVRAIRDTRYKYIRNYRTEKPYVLWMAYANVMPTMQELFRMSQEGELNEVQRLWMSPQRPVHELYDTESDPYEVNNLAYDPEHKETLSRLQNALDLWMGEVGDWGFIAEQEMVDYMWPDGIQPQTGPVAIIPSASMNTGITPDGLNPDASGGNFDSPVMVEMYSPTQGASITYTTGDQWMLYYEPILVSETTVFRAKAIRYGFAESEEVEVTFSFSN